MLETNYEQNGYVYYDRLRNETRPFWKNVGIKAEQRLGNYLSNSTINKTDLSSTLVSIASNERQNEIRFLSTIFGYQSGFDESNITLDSYEEFINYINLQIGMKDAYERFLIDTKKKTGGKRRNPNVATSFPTYLVQALNKMLRNSTDKVVRALEDPKEFDEFIDDLVDEMAEAMSNAQVDKVERERLGESKPWKDLYEVLKKDKYSHAAWKDLLIKRVHIETILREMVERNGSAIDRKSIRQAVDNTVSSTRAITGGYLQEIIQALMNKANTNPNIKIGGGTIKSNIPTTDNITLYSTNIEIQEAELTRLFEELNPEISETTKEGNRKIIEDFYEQHLKNLKDTFVVYESVKNVTLGDWFENAGGFNNGNPKELYKVSDDLESIGFSDIAQKAENLYQVLINAMDGALMMESKDRAMSELRLAICHGLANVFFDDWAEIGKVGTNAIHIFDLNSIKVPLSYLLFALSEALDIMENDEVNDSRYIKIEFNIPKQILYPEPVPIITYDGTTIVDHWNRQAEVAKKQSTYKVNFLSNFVDTISNLLVKVSANR